MQFRDLLGHEDLKLRLIRTVQEERISHALMFFGPPGSGKLSLALAYAQYISCSNRGENDSCGTCPSCIKYSGLVHPDLHFVFPVMTTSKISKDPVSDHYIAEWREALLKNPYINENQWYEAIDAENKQGLISKNESNEILRKLNLKSYEAEYKIMIIWLPEKMNPPAANALLKMIEEPPPKTLFLMVSENTGLILSTILSRTQLLRVPPLGDEEVRHGLRERGFSDEGIISDAVRKGNGNFSLALVVAENDEQEHANFELFATLMRLAYQRKMGEISEWVDRVSGLGRERIKQFLTFGLRMVRENFMLNIKKDEITFMSGEETEFSRKFAPFINRQNVMEIAAAFNDTANYIEANAYARIALMDMAITIIMQLRKTAPSGQ